MWMTNRDPNRKPVAATVAAILVILIPGGVRLVLAKILDSPVIAVPIAPNALDGLPLQIGDWIGIDVPLDESIARKTDTDAHISRRYSRGSSSGAISVYIGGGVNKRKLMAHRPQVCYSASGWTIVDRRSTELLLSDGTPLPCNIFQFSRGGVNTTEVIVLHYVIAGGRARDSISMLRLRLSKLLPPVRWVAQVQIVASAETITNKLANDLVRTFAIDSAPFIAKLFKDIEEDQVPGENREPKEDPI
jgi:hypothetical protein